MFFRFGRYMNRFFSTSQPHTSVTRLRKLSPRQEVGGGAAGGAVEGGIVDGCDVF